jgi:hypothetical protein
MSEVINGHIRLNQDETQNFLHMFYNPNLDALRRRDAFINSSREAVTLEDGVVSSIEIPDIDLSVLDNDRSADIYDKTNNALIYDEVCNVSYKDSEYRFYFIFNFDESDNQIEVAVIDKDWIQPANSNINAHAA